MSEYNQDPQASAQQPTKGVGWTAFLLIVALVAVGALLVVAALS